MSRPAMSAVMATADVLRAKAKQLYAQAERAEDRTERLALILQALERETEADTIDRSSADSDQ